VQDIVWCGAAAKLDERYDGIAALVTTAPLTSSADALFTTYKQQAYIERSHHEYKTPLAVAPVFLKSPKRVEALVCLLMLALQFRQVVERRYRTKHAQDKELSGRRMTVERLERAFRTCHAILWQQSGRDTLAPSRVPSRQRDILLSLHFPSLHRQLLHHQPSG
jgi:transposase